MARCVRAIADDARRSVMKVPVILALAFGAGACADRNANCEWPAEGPRSLDLGSPADLRHLRRDIELAEDLAIRYGDVRWGPGPSRQQGRQEQCLAPLFGHVARLHGVSLDDVSRVRETLGHKGLNLGTNLPAALFFALASWLTIRQIYARLSPRDELVAIVVASAAAAVAVGAVTVMFGRLWEGAFEMARLGNDHLSYRGLRRQWIQFAPEFFAAGTVLFWLIAGVRGWRVARQSSQ
jgi:hypothetical protein